MSFGQELKDFVSSFSAGYKMFADDDYKRKLGNYYDAMAEKARKGDGKDDDPVSQRFNEVYQRVTGGGAGGAGRVKAGDDSGDNDPDVADKDMAPEQKALLHSVYSSESPGYDVMYGGKRFAGFEDHPRVFNPITSGPNQGKVSSAAGRPQFLASTWDQQASKLGLKDFSPPNQDKAAWGLAADTYKSKTGRDLLADLRNEGPAAAARAGQVLRGVWTSLPGGLEEGTSVPRFQSAYQRYYNRYSGAQPPTPGATARTKPARVPAGQYQNTAAVDDSDLGDDQRPTFSAAHGGPITRRSSYADESGQLLIPADDEDGAPDDAGNDFRGIDFPDAPPRRSAPTPYRVIGRRAIVDGVEEPDPVQASDFGVNPGRGLSPGNMGGHSNPGRGADDRYLASPDEAPAVGAADVAGPNPGRGNDDRYLASPDEAPAMGAADVVGANPGRGTMERERVSVSRGPGGAGARPKGPAPRKAVADTEDDDEEPTAAPAKAAPKAAAKPAKAAPKAVDPEAAPAGTPALQPGETLYTDPKSGKRYAIPDDGRPMRMLDTGGDPLSKGLDAGIKFISKAFGMNARPAQAVDGPSPTTTGAQKLANGEGALTGAEYQQLVKVVDPEGKMTPGERNREVIRRVTDFGQKSGRPQEAAQLVGGVMLAQRRAVRVAGVMAEEALKNGDMVGATKILQKAYDAIPDGNTLAVEPTEDGQGYVFKQLDEHGKVMAQGPLTMDVLKQQIGLAKTGQAYDQHVFNAVQAGKGTQTMGAPGKAVDPTEPPATPGVKTAAAPAPVSDGTSAPAAPASTPSGLSQEDLATLPPHPGPRPALTADDLRGLDKKQAADLQSRFDKNIVAPWASKAQEYQKALRELNIRKRSEAKQDARLKATETAADAREKARIAAENERERQRIAAEDRRAAVTSSKPRDFDFTPDGSDLAAVNDGVDKALQAVTGKTTLSPDDIKPAHKTELRNATIQLYRYNNLPIDTAATVAAAMVRAGDKGGPTFKVEPIKGLPDDPTDGPRVRVVFENENAPSVVVPKNVVTRLDVVRGQRVKALGDAEEAKTRRMAVEATENKAKSEALKQATENGNQMEREAVTSPPPLAPGFGSSNYQGVNSRNFRDRRP